MQFNQNKATMDLSIRKTPHPPPENIPLLWVDEGFIFYEVTTNIHFQRPIQQEPYPSTNSQYNPLTKKAVCKRMWLSTERKLLESKGES
jgi:hypothetical protein